MSLSQELVQENIHSGLEKHFKEEALHYNLYEHKMNPITFVVRITIFGILGVVFGGLVNALFEKVQDNCTQRWKTRGFLVLQILILASFLYLASVVIGASVDDWVMATWSGFVFALTFFASQVTLNRNIECAIGK